MQNNIFHSIALLNEPRFSTANTSVALM